MSKTIDSSVSSADLYQPVGEFKGIKYFASDEAREVLEKRGIIPKIMEKMNPRVLRENIEASGLDYIMKGNACNIDLKAVRSTNLRAQFTPIDYSSIEGFVSGYVSPAAAEILRKENIVQHNESGRLILVKNAASIQDFADQIKSLNLECRPAHEVDTGRVAYIADKRTPLVSTRTTRVRQRRE